MDLHAITVPHDPVDLRASTRTMAATYLAAGIDPKRVSAKRMGREGEGGGRREEGGRGEGGGRKGGEEERERGGEEGSWDWLRQHFIPLTARANIDGEEAEGEPQGL